MPWWMWSALIGVSLVVFAEVLHRMRQKPIVAKRLAPLDAIFDQVRQWHERRTLRRWGRLLLRMSLFYLWKSIYLLRRQLAAWERRLDQRLRTP